MQRTIKKKQNKIKAFHFNGFLRPRQKNLEMLYELCFSRLYVKFNNEDYLQIKAIMNQLEDKFTFSKLLFILDFYIVLYFSRRTILAKIDIRQHLDAMQYSPGDHVLLYPENSPKLVYQLIRLLDDVPPENQQIMVERRAHSQGSISGKENRTCSYGTR